ncbi:MAG: HEPN domain-containing protein [candidate division NC10 bacterium]|nr:HEPN domain-containing protein [candidate division NC10 bacterium]
MAYEDLREKGLVEDIKPNFPVVSALIARAMKDLVTARANASIDREWAYAIAYQGMLRAARAMITAEGLRPRGRDQSRTVVLLAGAILGDDMRSLVNAFDRMRRRSQAILEEPGQPISRYEVEGSIKDAQKFIERTVEFTRTKNPQLTLL